MIEYQFYWRDWWRLWPHWISENVDQEWVGRYSENYFFFGPLQMFWYGPFKREIDNG